MSTSDVEQRVAKHTILRGLVGSTVHGLFVAARDQRAEVGIYIEPWIHSGLWKKLLDLRDAKVLPSPARDVVERFVVDTCMEPHALER